MAEMLRPLAFNPASPGKTTVQVGYAELRDGFTNVYSVGYGLRCNDRATADKVKLKHCLYRIRVTMKGKST